MFHEPVLYHKLYIKNVFYLFQHHFVLDHASIVLFPNKYYIIIIITKYILIVRICLISMAKNRRTKNKTKCAHSVLSVNYVLLMLLTDQTVLFLFLVHLSIVHLPVYHHLWTLKHVSMYLLYIYMDWQWTILFMEYENDKWKNSNTRWQCRTRQILINV